MNYPHEFSTEAQSRVEAEQIRAARELDVQMQALPVGYAAYTEKREALVAHSILEVVWAFAKEAGALGQSRIWSIARIRSEVDKFLFQRELVAETKFHEHIRGKIFSCHSKTRASGYLKTWFEELPRWKEYEDMLLGLGVEKPAAQSEALAQTFESPTPESPAVVETGHVLPVVIAPPAEQHRESTTMQTHVETGATKLTDREQKIWEVIQRGTEGAEYSRELHNAGLRPRKGWIKRGCPGTYTAAYMDPDTHWRQMVQDEKSKISRKAELANH